MAALTQKELKKLLVEAAALGTSNIRVEEIHRTICQSATLIVGTKRDLQAPVPVSQEEQAASLQELTQALQSGAPSVGFAQDTLKRFGNIGEREAVLQTAAVVAFVSALYLDAVRYYRYHLPQMFPAFALACCESAEWGGKYVNVHLL